MTASRRSRNGRRPAARSVRVLSEAESRRFLDRWTQKLMGISGEEFLRLAREGSLPDTAATGHLLTLTCGGRG